jgi:hypothetical protein
MNMQWFGSVLHQVQSDIRVYAVCSSSCTAHGIYITMDLIDYAATPLHVHNDVILPNIFNNCNFS